MALSRSLVVAIITIINIEETIESMSNPLYLSQSKSVSELTTLLPLNMVNDRAQLRANRNSCQHIESH